MGNCCHRPPSNAPILEQQMADLLKFLQDDEENKSSPPSPQKPQKLMESKSTQLAEIKVDASTQTEETSDLDSIELNQISKYFGLKLKGKSRSRMVNRKLEIFSEIIDKITKQEKENLIEIVKIMDHQTIDLEPDLWPIHNEIESAQGFLNQCKRVVHSNPRNAERSTEERKNAIRRLFTYGMLKQKAL